MLHLRTQNKSTYQYKTNYNYNFMKVVVHTRDFWGACFEQLSTIHAVLQKRLALIICNIIFKIVSKR